MFPKHIGYLIPTCKIFCWAVMVKGYVLVNRRPTVLPGGSFYSEIGFAGTALASVANPVAMAREGLVSFVLEGVNSESVTRRLRQETPFCVIFGAYVGQFGYNQAVTRFSYLHGVVE